MSLSRYRACSSCQPENSSAGGSGRVTVANHGQLRPLPARSRGIAARRAALVQPRWWSMYSFLQARDLVKVYGDRRVLDGVSLTASP